MGDEHDEEALPLLRGGQHRVEKPITVTGGEVFQALKTQLRIALPLMINFMALYSQSLVIMAFVGKVATTQLAAVAFGNTLVNIVARLVLIGLTGALDTQASQAFGAGNLEALPVIFQRTLLFLWAHCALISFAMLTLPVWLSMAGQSDLQFMTLTAKYLMAMVPAIWVDATNRAVNSMLVAQGVSQLQMWVSMVMVPLHTLTCWLLVNVLKMGYIGGAVSELIANLYIFGLTQGAICQAGMWGRVWGRPSLAALRGWRDVARLAYPSCIMRCAESWCYASSTLWAGLLPDPTTSVAAVAVAFSIQGTLFMPFAALTAAVVSTIGNALGSGKPRQGKASAIAAGVIAPAIALVVVTILSEPHCQLVLLVLFGGRGDAKLAQMLRSLLLVAAVSVVIDGVQTMMSGVLTGCGKQKHGAAVNLVAYYVVAMPLALLLGFYFRLGVVGIYLGMASGPLLQLFAYSAIIWRLEWHAEAAAAQQRAADTHALQTPSLLPPTDSLPISSPSPSPSPLGGVFGAVRRGIEMQLSLSPEPPSDSTPLLSPTASTPSAGGSFLPPMKLPTSLPESSAEFISLLNTASAAIPVNSPLPSLQLPTSFPPEAPAEFLSMFTSAINPKPTKGAQPSIEMQKSLSPEPPVDFLSTSKAPSSPSCPKRPGSVPPLIELRKSLSPEPPSDPLPLSTPPSTTTPSSSAPTSAELQKSLPPQYPLDSLPLSTPTSTATGSDVAPPSSQLPTSDAPSGTVNSAGDLPISPSPKPPASGQ